MAEYIDKNKLENFAMNCVGGVVTMKQIHEFPAADVVERKPSRLIDADELYLELVNEGQLSKRYKLGEKWELNGEEIRRVINRISPVSPAEEDVNHES